MINFANNTSTNNKHTFFIRLALTPSPSCLILTNLNFYMIAKRTILTMFPALFCISAWADTADYFPEKGKVYTLHRYSKENSYMYEKGNQLYAGPSSNTEKQYWSFIPTENANCFYIQNVTSKHYVQSTHVAENTQIATGKEPVEFKIMKDENSSPTGYYYVCSTDQNVDNTTDGTLGLNYQESTGRIVAFHIRYNRGNSYWDIQETAYDYIAPSVSQPTALAKRLGIYNLPCGDTGTAYLTYCTVTGEGVTDELDYRVTTKPSDYYVLIRKDSVGVVPGGKFKLDYEASGIDAYHTTTAYFDWNGDGVFETKHGFMNAQSGTAEFTVPDTAKTGKVRMRIRLTDNDCDGAEEEVHGQIYDFMMYVTKKNEETGIAHTEMHEKNASDTHAYNVEGKRVNPNKHKGVYIKNGKKRFK